MFRNKKFAIVSNLGFISMKNFMLSKVEHEKSFINSGLLKFLFLCASVASCGVYFVVCLFFISPFGASGGCAS